MEILEKISPKNISNFAGNKVVINNITKILQSFKTQTSISKNILCITGPDGSGKTTLCRLLFNKVDFEILQIGKDVLTNDNIKTIIENFANNTTIEHYILKKQKLVFIDDVDILLCIDRNLVSKILTLNNILKKKKVSIIVTYNCNVDKKLFADTEAEYFKISYPSCKDTFSYLMHKFDIEGIDYDMDKLLEITTKHKGNVRETVLNLHNTVEDLQHKSIERAFKDMNQFEVAKSILGQRNTSTEINSLCKGDVGNLPYILYENLPLELETNYKTPDLLETYLRVNNHFVDATTLEDHAYACLDWGILHYANILRTSSVHYSISQQQPKATQKNLLYKYSQMRSKSSHKKILGKKVKTFSNQTQTSEVSLMVAADTLAREKNKLQQNNVKYKGNKKDAIQDLTCLISTYEKYFV